MKRIFVTAMLGWILPLAFWTSSGCNVMDLAEGYDSSYCGSCGSSSSEDETKDLLLVSGSGENRTLEYNTLTFPALLNWQDGNYYFSPDPDGSISGHKIICLASIEDYDLEGDCFRDGRVCHFSYYETWSGSSNSEKDAYRLSSTSCKTAAEVGPFLVTLEAPLCGEDPYPACPPDNLFPSGLPSETTDDAPSAADDAVDSASAADALVQELCAATARCDKTLSEAECDTAMDGDDGLQIWDNFGLMPENSFTTAQVVEAIDDGTVTVNETALNDCLQELAEACDNTGETFPIGSYDNVENLILEEGACPSVLSSKAEATPGAVPAAAQ
jgi:hypothetical protein